MILRKVTATGTFSQKLSEDKTKLNQTKGEGVKEKEFEKVSENLFSFTKTDYQ